MAQLGIGDPNQGVRYTLGSVSAAVVLSGASLAGGRGTFIGVLLGAVTDSGGELVDGVPRPVAGLATYWFIGLLTLIAVALAIRSRSCSFHERRDGRVGARRN